jgi:TonB-linked SusC/RagA family outer membrane protein
MSRRQSVPQLFGWALFAATLALFPTRALAQEPVTITGRVTAATGEALRDVNVTIFELGIGVWTGADGTYRLNVPGARASGQQVRVTARLIGFRAQSNQITLAPGATIQQNFQLAADPLRLEEVVVTGAGTQQSREKLGTANATVDAGVITRANETNVVQALAGKVPGVVTNQGSGDAGASTAIQIRGAKTFGTSQPTIIVDGVPISNNTRGQAVLSGIPSPNRAADINPEDIESIEILKGASAASIYGVAAGSAGAILITTKKGQAGRTQYSLRTTFQADQPVKYVPVQRSFGAGTGGVSPTCRPSTSPTLVNCSIPAGQFFSWGAAIPDSVPTYDHSREIYETGFTMDNTLSMSGGNDRTTFYLSGGLLHQDGFITNNVDTYERYTMRFSGSHRLFENLTLTVNGAAVQTKGGGLDRGNSINGIGISALRQPPDFNAKQYLSPVTGYHRSWRFPNPGPTCGASIPTTCNRGFDNPFYALYKDALTGQTGRYYGNLNVNWLPLNWMQVNWTFGGDYNSDDRTYAYGPASSGTPGGQMERWQFYDRVLDHNLTVTGTHEFNQNVRGSLTFGQNLNETYFRQIDVTAQTWIAPTPYKLSNTVTRLLPNDAESRRRIEGYFGQANVDLYDQVFLQARLRNDANSAFGVNHQRAWYPGASAAWSFTKTFNVPERYLTFGKFRMAYGESGQQPPLYTTQDVFITNSFADFNPGSRQGTTLNGLGGLYASANRGNPEISPERVKELEAGFDLSFLNGRTDLSITRYVSKSQDIVFGVSLPPSTGYTSINLNAGALENKGWELTSNIRALQRPDYSFEIGFNWARNRNIVTSLGMIDAQIQGTVDPPTPENCGAEALLPRCVTGFASSFSGQSTHAQVGYPLGVWRSNDFARCGRGLNMIGNDSVGFYCNGQPDGALYIAASGLPIVDPNTRAIGNPWPDWTAGISATFTYKGVQVSAFVDHRHGGDVLNMTRSSMYQYGTHKDTEMRGQYRTFGDNMLCHNQTCDVLNGTVVGPGAGDSVLIGEAWFTGAAGGSTAGPITTRLEDATFTRLREISLSYSFRGGWVRKLAGFEQVDVKLSGRNLGLWTRYSGLDPEVNLGGAQNANRGIDWFNTPLSRSWVFQVALLH